MMIDRDKSGKKNNQPEVNTSHQPDSKPPRKPKWRGHFLRWGGSLLLVSLGGGLVYGWFFVQNRLVPLIETELIDLLNRPVKMGSLQRFSLTGARFGETEILATPTDPAKVSVAAVEVGFNPFAWLTSGELQLDVTAIQPDVYLEQGKNRRWLLTEFDSSGNRKKRFKVNLETLRLQDADVILRARSQTGNLQSPVKVFIDSGKADFFDKGKIIGFDLSGELANGGDIEVSGTGMLKTEAINLVLRGNEIQATDVGNLLPLPFALQAGTIGANLEVRIRPQQIARLQGIATLDTVTARLPTLTRSFAQSNGILRFRETEIYLENVTSRFGSIPAIANGIVDLQKGYNLKAKTEPIRVQQVIEALKLKKPPVPIIGELKADIQVTGSIPQPGQPLAAPVVSIDGITTKTTRIDRVDFLPGSTAQLQLIGSNLVVNRFQAVPTVGGQLTGTGKIKVESRKSKVESFFELGSQNSEFKFDIDAINVPAGAIARLYQTTLPINPGLVSGRAQFLGTLEHPEQLKATGAASFKLGDGTVSASNFQYANRSWQGNIRASGVNLASLNPSLPQQVRQGRLNGIFNVAGGIDAFTPESIRATGSANVAIANGTVTANNITLANGRWVTTVRAKGIDSDRILPNLPSQFTGILDGTFNLAGNTHASLQNVRGNGTANFVLPQGKIAAEDIQLANGEFKAVVRPNEVTLKQFYKEGKGTVDGELNIFGNLEKP
ncbi:MAG: hypothetical protein MUD14_02365, partial [Hydrococcus sp. Prado102]|nr:hypothetical protein [Hydrococcus sp. Prado102]